MPGSTRWTCRAKGPTWGVGRVAPTRQMGSPVAPVPGPVLGAPNNDDRSSSGARGPELTIAPHGLSYRGVHAGLDDRQRSGVEDTVEWRTSLLEQYMWVNCVCCKSKSETLTVVNRSLMMSHVLDPMTLNQRFLCGPAAGPLPVRALKRPRGPF